jgi:hypothetical protein
LFQCFHAEISFHVWKGNVGATENFGTAKNNVRFWVMCCDKIREKAGRDCSSVSKRHTPAGLGTFENRTVSSWAKQNKAGRWRKAKVPDYANDQRRVYVIDEQMRKLGRLERYNKELSKITKAKKLPHRMGDGGAEKQRRR